MNRPSASAVLRQAGITNPARLVGLIRQAIRFLELDLSGLVVLTEAASGPYVVTPIIAALAGAERVIALTRASRYGTVEAVVAQTQALAELCGAAVELHTDRDPALFTAADLITNLGFVRPLDAAAIGALKPTAVIPLMCEGWEVRPGDVDLAACVRRGIPVISTNEDFPGLEVFAYSGWLALRLLFDAQIEIHKSRLAVVSGDKFGGVIADRLWRAGANVRQWPHLRDAAAADLAALDALIIADYTRDDLIVGPGGDLSAAELAAACPEATVVQFAGRGDVAGLMAHGMTVYPGIDLPAHRMALTLAALGPRPVVELHAAGLKVGELAARARLGGRALAELDEIILWGHLLGTRLA